MPALEQEATCTKRAGYFKQSKLFTVQTQSDYLPLILALRDTSLVELSPIGMLEKNWPEVYLVPACLTSFVAIRSLSLGKSHQRKGKRLIRSRDRTFIKA